MNQSLYMSTDRATSAFHLPGLSRLAAIRYAISVCPLTLSISGGAKRRPLHAVVGRRKE
jgi:hypothetical protein